MCGSPGYTIAGANSLIGLLWVKPASKAGAEVLIKKTEGWKAKLIYTFCNTSQGRMRAAGNSSKRLLVCLGAQNVLQTNTGKPRTGLNIREGDNWRPLYCCFHFSLEHYSGCCPGRRLSTCSALPGCTLGGSGCCTQCSDSGTFLLRPRKFIGISSG